MVQYANHEDEDEHSDVGRDRHEEHRHAYDRQNGVGPPEDADFAFPVGERFRQRRTNQVADAVGSEEQGEDARRAHDPGAVVHHRAATYADGQNVEERQQADDAPLVVLPDVAQVFTDGGGARWHLDALFGGEEAERQHHKGDHGEHRDATLEAEGFVVTANQVHQRHHQYGREHAACRRQHKAPGLQGDTLFRVVGNHAAQRAVRDIDHGVEQRQQCVGDGGVNQFTVVSEVRGAVGQHAHQAKGNGTEEYPRAEFPPAAAGTVGNQPHAGVGDGIEGACQQEHGAHEPGGNAEDIGIEEHHIEHDVVKNDMAGGVAHTVANFFLHRDDVRVHEDSLRADVS